MLRESMVQTRTQGINRVRAYLRELGKYVDLHSYGRHGTYEIPNDRGHETKLEICRSYKFTIAFENARSFSVSS